MAKTKNSIMTFKQVDEWILRQDTGGKNYTVRYSIPGYPKFKLEVSPKGKKVIRFYSPQNGKAVFVKIGEIPYITFEAAFKKGASYVNQEEEPRNARTFREVWTEFIKKNPLRFKDKTIHSYTVRTNKHILNTSLADMDISDISVSDLKLQIFNVCEHIPATNVKLFYVIDNVLKFAKKNNWIAENVLETYKFNNDYEVPNKKNTEHHPKIVNPQDLKKFLENICLTPKIALKKRILVLFGLETALRSMNIFGLRWEDIDWDKKLVKFDKSRMKGELKTEKSRQDFILPLSGTMIELLTYLKKLEKSNGKGLVFDGVADQVINYLLKKMANITKHGLRGSFKTFAMKQMVNHGIPNYIIEMYMSHIPSMNDVEAAYTDLRYDDIEIQDMLRELAEWWDRYLLSLFNFKEVLLGVECNDD